MKYQTGKHEGYECATMTLRAVRFEDGNLLTILEPQEGDVGFWERDQQLNIFLLSAFLQRELVVQASGILGSLGDKASDFLVAVDKGGNVAGPLFHELVESRLLRMVERQIRHMSPDAFKRLFTSYTQGGG